MSRLTITALTALVALALAACSSGPSGDEIAAWKKFAHDRQDEHAQSDYAGPHSVREYVLGADDGSGFDGADGIYTGWFLSASEDKNDDGVTHVYAVFHVDGSIRGKATGDITVDIGLAPQAEVDVDAAVRGAGTAVVFLTRDHGDLRLAEQGFSIATTDKEGRLSMPLVSGGQEALYLSGVTDVADVAALAIAGKLDKTGQLGDDGISDSEQSAIDKANQIAGNN